MARSKKGWLATDEYDVGTLVQKIWPLVSAAPSRLQLEKRAFNFVKSGLQAPGCRVLTVFN